MQESGYFYIWSLKLRILQVWQLMLWFLWFCYPCYFQVIFFCLTLLILSFYIRQIHLIYQQVSLFIKKYFIKYYISSERKFIQFPGLFLNQVQQIVSKIYQMSKEAQIKQKILSIFTSQDLFHKAFLRPLQVILRTKSIDPGYYTRYDNGLPQGLMIAEKQRGDMRQNIYTPTVINPVPDDYVTKYSYEDLQANNEDNLISLLKKQKNGIELAICVCMYSEDKKMLKTTLAGIGENIDRLVAGGLDPDKIAVVVVMDGIQHVHETVVEYFEDLERQSEIYLTEDAPELNQVLEEREEGRELDEEDSQLKKRNYFLFDIEQLKQRRINRFSARKAEYHEIKNLRNQIDQLLTKKNALTYEVLNKRLQEFYIKKAKEQKKEDFGLDENQVNQLSEQALVQEYSNNLTRSRAIIESALREAKRYCSEYIASRDQLAYVNAFRTGVFLEEESKNEYSQVPFTNEQLTKNQKKKEKKEGYNALQEEEDLKKIKMNLFLCVRYKNSGKLSSHNWFFNGFCHKEILNPKYAILLDTGLRPHHSAIYKMYHYMKKHTEVGGVCGYMKLKLQKAQDHEVPETQHVDWFTQQFHRMADIQRAQQIEYHLAHLIDKPFESVFRFIHVLPGAFSGYNMSALIPESKQSDDPKRNNEEQNARLLKNYFKALDEKIKEEPPKASEFTTCRALSKVLLPDLIYNCCYPPDEKTEQGLLYNENINLAEDRILCLGIHQHNKSLAFLPDAQAYVDPIKSTHALFGQRKRWINGSFFAFEKVKREIARGNRCEFCLHIQIAFLSFMNMLAFVAPALFMFTVSVAMQAFRADVLTKFFADIIPYNSEIYNAFVLVMNFIYALLWLGFILYSIHMNNKNPKFISYIYATSTIMGIFSLVVMVVLTVDIIRGLIGDSSFTIQNQKFIEEIPGGQITIDSLRYVILLIIGLYVVPIVVYGMCFCRFSFACEVLFSVFAFFFYTPTYLILLNTYALCRIDDISWGTKGLDSHKATKKDDKIMETWKVIKFLYVAKLVFWNVVVAALLLHFGNSFKIRFFITFGIMFILAITLAIKVILGVFYYCGYCCKRVRDKPMGNKRKVSHLLEEFNQFEVKIKKSIGEHLDVYLTEAKKMKLKSFDLGSIMMIPKNREVSKIFQKKSANLAKDRSNIIRKESSKDRLEQNLPSSGGLNQKQPQAQQLNQDLPTDSKEKPKKQKKFKKAAFF